MDVETGIFEKSASSESGRITGLNFSDNEQAIQRFMDDELGTATSQAVQQMIDGSPELAKSYKDLQFIDQELHQASVYVYVDEDVQHDAIASIMSALPQATPNRERNASIAEIALAALLMAGIVSSYAFAGTSSALASI
ncbi:MAG: hypothetical protein HRU15_20895, partial [Planctomycetes bacterium]|nr:hypothetical protein [Planctomycetota bacterium]